MLSMIEKSMPKKLSMAAITTSLLLLLLVGCAAEESGEFSNAFSDPFGGMNTKDEIAAFSDADIAAISNGVQFYDDPTSKEVDVLVASQLADAEENLPQPSCRKLIVKINWGQLDGNPSMTTVTDWSGNLQTSAGVLILLDKLFFETADNSIVDDEILPRTNRQQIDFISHTTIHQDGVLAALLYGSGCGLSGDSGASPTLTLTTPAFTKSLQVSDIGSEYNEIFTVDALNNQVAMKLAQVKSCGGGIVEGGWKQINDNLPFTHGMFRGALLGRDGQVKGYIKGISGNHNSHNLVFAKIIDTEGHFVSRARGTYDAVTDSSGKFRMFTHDRDNQKVGLIRGRYVDPFSDHAAGLFFGHWKYFCTTADNDMSAAELDEKVFGFGSEN